MESSRTRFLLKGIQGYITKLGDRNAEHTHTMQLTEDYCLGRGLSYPEEKTKLLQQGYTLVHEYCHPAVGLVSVYSLPTPPLPGIWIAVS